MKNYNIITASILSLLAIGCKAQPGIKTTEVFMYKNGYTYVHKSGSVNLENGIYTIGEKEIPPAVFGAIWLKSDKSILYTKRVEDTVLNAIYQPSIEQMLMRSKGKIVKMSISTESGTEVIEGEVVTVFEVPFGLPSGNFNNPAIATIRTAAGDVVLYRGTLAKILFASFPAETQWLVQEKAIKPALKVIFDGAPKQAELDLVYLQSHPAWAPSYRLKLGTDKKASLLLSAEVSSGNVDMTNTRLNLVAGSPQVFGYGILSRLTGYESINYPGEAPEAAYDDAVENRAAWKNDTEAAGVETGQAEDYFVYTIKNFSLQKNQTALVNILSETVEVDHIYESQLYSINEYSQPALNHEPQIMPVYHILEFKNPSSLPLTAGPVFVETSSTSGGAMLGQPVLNTVAIGGKAKINIAESQSIPLTHTELEASRVSNAHTYTYGVNQIYFDKVTINAVIKVENQGATETHMKIYRNIQGKTLNSDLAWEVKTLPPSSSGPNSNNDILWSFKLKPGEKKEIKYSYEYFLRLY